MSKASFVLVTPIAIFAFVFTAVGITAVTTVEWWIVIADTIIDTF